MELKKIKLSEIKEAEYNPRKITAEALEGLKKSIERFGQIENLIVNKDMTLISGHQRKKAMEELGEKEAWCKMVDMNKVEEKILNITMNNTAISGDFDVDLLKELVEEISKEDMQAIEDLLIDNVVVEIEKIGTLEDIGDTVDSFSDKNKEIELEDMEDSGEIRFKFNGEQYMQVLESLERLVQKYKLDNKEQVLLHLIKEFDV